MTSRMLFVFQPHRVQRPGVHTQPMGSARVHAALQHPGVSPHGRHGTLQPPLPPSPHPAALRAGQHHLGGDRRSAGQRPATMVSARVTGTWTCWGAGAQTPKKGTYCQKCSVTELTKGTFLTRGKRGGA